MLNGKSSTSHSVLSLGVVSGEFSMSLFSMLSSRTLKAVRARWKAWKRGSVW